MQPLVKRIEAIRSGIKDAYKNLAIDAKVGELAMIDAKLADAGVWENVEEAQALSKQSAALRAQISPWQSLKEQSDDIVEFLTLGEASDNSLLNELEVQINGIEKVYENLKKELLFRGEYDNHDTILRLSAGVGGTDAQDWTEMLERMYLRWAERSGMSTSIIERSAGEEAGIKSVVIEVNGPFAYGKLKSEHGVHRLVRLSPFNSDNLRQTSFALVEVLPQIDTPDEVQIDDKDLKIDVFRAGGHGGQSVNTTDSAVRVTHVPTGITVSIQNERSQLQNKETALKVLRSKLAQLRLEQHAASISELRAGESANWGSQIRNYVLHPYTMVKDTRTKHEAANAQAVLDGDIDGFIYSFLEKNVV